MATLMAYAGFKTAAAQNTGSGRTVKILITAIVIVIIFNIFSAYYSYNFYKDAGGSAGCEQQIKVVYNQNIFSKSAKIEGERSVSMKLPAVNGNDSGVSAVLSAGAKKGTGNIFVAINDILSNPDTQHSVRSAAIVAANYENKSLEEIDLFYSISAFAPAIEGPSAGAALAVSTVAVLENKTLNPDVMMTGTINHDGTIGPSGKILEKARAAKQAGAKIFLVPIGLKSGLETNYTENNYCKVWGKSEYCSMEITPAKIDIEKETGISIIEVADLKEALKYFIQ